VSLKTEKLHETYMRSAAQPSVQRTDRYAVKRTNVLATSSLMKDESTETTQTATGKSKSTGNEAINRN